MAERTPKTLQRLSEGQLKNQLDDLEADRRDNNNPQKNGVEATYLASATPDVDDPIHHNLGRVPTGFNVLTKDAAADVYQGVNRWTDKIIFVRSTVGGVTAKLFIF